MALSKEMILEAVSGDAYSLGQIGEKLGVDAENHELRNRLVDLIDSLIEKNELGVAFVRRNAVVKEGAKIAPRDLRYYMLYEGVRLEQKKILSAPVSQIEGSRLVGIARGGGVVKTEKSSLRK